MSSSKALIDIWGEIFIYTFSIYTTTMLQKKLQNLSTFHFTDVRKIELTDFKQLKNKTNGNYHHLVDEKIEEEKNSRITIEENNKSQHFQKLRNHRLE